MATHRLPLPIRPNRPILVLNGEWIRPNWYIIFGWPGATSVVSFDAGPFSAVTVTRTQRPSGRLLLWMETA